MGYKVGYKMAIICNTNATNDLGQKHSKELLKGPICFEPKLGNSLDIYSRL